MTNLRTAAQQALEYMKSVGKMDMHPEEWAIIERLEAALAVPVQEPDSPERRCGGPGCDGACCQPVQEPVAWMVYTEGGTSAYVTDNPNDLVGAYRALALYTAPPQRPVEPVQEPVAGVVLNEEGRAALVEHGREEWHCVVRNARRLYTAPPQRKPLSEDEIFKIENDIPDDVISDRAWTIWFARAIERAHGIKE